MDNITQGSSAAALPPGQLGGGSIATAGASLNNALMNMFTLMNLQNKLKALGIKNSMDDAQLGSTAMINAGDAKAQGRRIEAFGNLANGGISLGSSGIAAYTQYQAGVQGSALSDPSIVMKEAYDITPAAASAVPGGPAVASPLRPAQRDRFVNFSSTEEHVQRITPESMAVFKRDFPIGTDERTAFESKLTEFANGTSAQHKMISETSRSKVQTVESIGQGLNHLSSSTTGFISASYSQTEAKKDADAALFQASSQAANAAVQTNDSSVQAAEQIIKIITDAYNQLAASGNR
jgi:hypothetical protein